MYVLFHQNSWCFNIELSNCRPIFSLIGVSFPFLHKFLSIFSLSIKSKFSIIISIESLSVDFDWCVRGPFELQNVSFSVQGIYCSNVFIIISDSFILGSSTIKINCINSGISKFIFSLVIITFFCLSLPSPRHTHILVVLLNIVFSINGSVFP